MSYLLFIGENSYYKKKLRKSILNEYQIPFWVTNVVLLWAIMGLCSCNRLDGKIERRGGKNIDIYLVNKSTI